jgi:hypothetical protein
VIWDTESHESTGDAESSQAHFYVRFFLLCRKRTIFDPHAMVMWIISVRVGGAPGEGVGCLPGTIRLYGWLFIPSLKFLSQCLEPISTVAHAPQNKQVTTENIPAGEISSGLLASMVHRPIERYKWITLRVGIDQCTSTPLRFETKLPSSPRFVLKYVLEYRPIAGHSIYEGKSYANRYSRSVVQRMISIIGLEPDCSTNLFAQSDSASD